jgi:hypothetical protein
MDMVVVVLSYVIVLNAHIASVHVFVNYMDSVQIFLLWYIS